MKKTPLTIGIIIVLTIVIALFFQTSPSKPDNTILRVGSILSLTGPAGFFGTELKNGMDLANQLTNLEITHEDSKSTPADGISAFQKILSRGKPDILIVMQSSVAGAVTPVAIEKRVPVLQTLVSASKVAAQSPYTFRYFTSGEQEAPIMGNLLVDKLEAKNIAIIHINDEYGLSYAEAMKKTVESKGGSIAAIESYTRTDTDYKTHISKIAALNPDAIYIIGQDGPLLSILKQMKEMKIKAKLATNWILSDPSIRERASGLEEGVYLTTPGYYLNSPDKSLQDFMASYEKTYGKAPSAYAAIGYDVINTLSLIKKNPTGTPEDIINKFTDLKEVKGIMGNLTIDSEGEVTFPLYPALIENGKMIELK